MAWLRHLFLSDKDVIEVFVQLIGFHHIMYGITFEFPKHVHHTPSCIVIVKIAIDMLVGFSRGNALGRLFTEFSTNKSAP